MHNFDRKRTTCQEIYHVNVPSPSKLETCHSRTRSLYKLRLAAGLASNTVQEQARANLGSPTLVQKLSRSLFDDFNVAYSTESQRSLTQMSACRGCAKSRVALQGPKDTAGGLTKFEIVEIINTLARLLVPCLLDDNVHMYYSVSFKIATMSILRQTINTLYHRQESAMLLPRSNRPAIPLREHTRLQLALGLQVPLTLQIRVHARDLLIVLCL